MKNNDNKTPIEQLQALLARLRDPKKGVPWDRAQTFDSISKHLLEETYELIDALDSRDWDHVRDELGDVILQVVYIAQIASEGKLFTFSDAAQNIVDKIMRRYAAVFESKDALTPDQVAAMWNKAKAAEKKSSPKTDSGPAKRRFGPKTAPALIRAAEVVKHARRDNMVAAANAGMSIKKVQEELREFTKARDKKHREEEMGDLLFSVVNLCDEHGINPERAMQKATKKFIRRWQGMHDLAMADGLDLKNADNKTLDRYWDAVKKREKSRLL